MTALVLIFGIACVFLTFFLIQEIRKNKKLSNENDGLRELSMNREINIEKALRCGLPVETIASNLASKIQFMVESNASIKSVLDICDETGITQKLTIPVGVQSDIDKVRIRIQEIIEERFDHEKLRDWVDSSRLDKKQLKRINTSFFRSIPRSMLVWTLDN